MHHVSSSRTVGRSLIAIALVAGGLTAATASVTSADGDRVRDVKMRDECDPATFNAVLGEGACVGDGDVTFGELIATINPQDFGHPKWRNQPSSTDEKVGTRLHVVNRGGETHTFTEVANFGPGIVPELNGVFADGTPAAVPVGPPNFTPPGGTADIPPLAKGTHKFQCLIHPWMQTTVKVK